MWGPPRFLIRTGAATFLACNVDRHRNVGCKAPKAAQGAPPAQRKYTRAEVALHNSKEKQVWVTYKDHVYDVTSFIDNHPGGSDKLMLAAGKALDPFWRIYQQHEGRGNAPKILDALKIGELADPVAPTPQDSLDPYDADPERHPGLIFHNNKPCNAEAPAELLLDSWLTPNSVWFIRHHHPVPHVNPDEYRLTISGLGAQKVVLTLDDLKKRFTKRKVTSTIQCGGNRRSEFDKIEQTSGIGWGFGAMSTAEFEGVSLREILQYCAGVGMQQVEWHDIRHVIFFGMDDMQASIPIEKALNPWGDALLAYRMNGEDLPPEHGFPVRAVVPGVVGVRNVKWVSRIETSQVEAEGPWQRGIAYKGFSPMVKTFSHVNIESVLSMQDMPVQSAILSPKDGFKTELDDITVKGFAWSGGGRGIVRVDVSVDGGKTWNTAELKEGKDQHPYRAWAWTLWECTVDIPEDKRGKEFTILCRATDAAYSTQPERPEPIWNVRGLLCNSWHRVRVLHEDDDD